MVSRAEAAPFNEKALLYILATVQFTLIVDFLIIMPLGPQYMRVFSITPGQFGLIVSSYAISAGIAGLAAGLFLDRFDRKQAMLVLYLGFAVGTFLCAVAPTYVTLVAARAVAGAFGGVTGALILAVVGDVVPEFRRGAAMGLVMSSFSIASIFGVPLGLVLANNFSWHFPFLVLAGLSLLILVPILKIMPPLHEHLHHARDQHPVRRMLEIMMHKEHQLAFLFMAGLTITGFMFFPYLSNYLVANAGVKESQLSFVYLSGGICTLFSMNWIGRWADRAGKPKVFRLMSLLAIVPILAFTNLPKVHVVLAIATSTTLMICMSGRMVPAMAMMTASIEGRYRGGFMSINSAVQQFSAGLAAVLSGQIMGVSRTGQITHFNVIGWLSVVFALTCIYLARFLKPVKEPGPPEAMLPVEG